VILLVGGSRIIGKVEDGSDYGTLRLAFLLTTLFYGVTESVFDRLDLVWLILLLVILEYPRQERAALGEDVQEYSVKETGRPVVDAVNASP